MASRRSINSIHTMNASHFLLISPQPNKSSCGDVDARLSIDGASVVEAGHKFITRNEITYHRLPFRYFLLIIVFLICQEFVYNRTRLVARFCAILIALHLNRMHRIVCRQQQVFESKQQTLIRQRISQECFLANECLVLMLFWWCSKCCNVPWNNGV